MKERIIATAICVVVGLLALLRSIPPRKNGSKVNREPASLVNSDTTRSEIDLETARAGYSIAVQLWIFSGEMVWQRLGALLVSNSILSGSVGLLVSSRRDATPIILILCGIGSIVCLFWLFILQRASVYQEYYIASAVEIEEQYLKPVQTTSRGRDLSRGVGVKVHDEIVPFKLSRAANVFNSLGAARLLVLVFITVYFSAAALTISDTYNQPSSGSTFVVSAATPVSSSIP